MASGCACLATKKNLRRSESRSSTDCRASWRALRGGGTTAWRSVSGAPTRTGSNQARSRRRRGVDVSPYLARCHIGASELYISHTGVGDVPRFRACWRAATAPVASGLLSGMPTTPGSNLTELGSTPDRRTPPDLDCPHPTRDRGSRAGVANPHSPRRLQALGRTLPVTEIRSPTARI